MMGSEKKLNRASAASLVLYVKTGGILIFGTIGSSSMVMFREMGSSLWNSTIPSLLLLLLSSDNRS